MAEPIALFARGPDIGGAMLRGSQVRRNDLLNDLTELEMDLVPRKLALAERKTDLAGRALSLDQVKTLQGLRDSEREAVAKNLSIVGSLAGGLLNVPQEARAQVFESRIKPILSQIGMPDAIEASELDDNSLTSAFAMTKEGLKVLTDKPSIVQQAEFAFPDDPEGQRGFVREKGGSGGVTVNMGANEQAGMEKLAENLGKERAKRLFDRRDVALDAVDSLRSAKQAKKLLQGGIITGAGADWIVAFGKALNQIGFNVGQDAIANTEAFVGQRAQEVGRMIKMFGAGTGLSDADRAFAEKAAAGNINMTEGSIRRLLRIQEEASRNVIERFNRDRASVPEPLKAFVPAVDVPATAGEATGPEPGDVEDGYRFKGGDPADPASWERVR